MIGAGVFTTSGFALQDLGDRRVVMLAWLVGGLLALCGAVCYGALGRRIPESGGEYTFLTVSFHPLAGFLAGWVSLLAGFTAPIALAALGLQSYLTATFAIPGRPEWIGTIAILTAGMMHGLYLRQGVWIQNVAVALKVVVVAAFVALGAGAIPPASATASAVPSGVDLGAFAVALVWIMFSYSGWNAVVYVAGEVRAPDRNLMRVLCLATVGVTVLYIGLNAIFLWAAPADVIAGKVEVGAIAAEALGGPVWKRWISVIVAMALFTSVSAMVMAGPRVYARMAADGLMPRILDAGSEVPAAAVAFQVLLAIVVVWFTGLAQLLSYIGFTLGLSAAMTVVGLMKMRREESAKSLPIPGYPVVPVLFIGVTVAASVFMVARRPTEAIIGLLTALSGVPVYLWMRRGRP